MIACACEYQKFKHQNFQNGSRDQPEMLGAWQTIPETIVENSFHLLGNKWL